MSVVQVPGNGVTLPSVSNVATVLGAHVVVHTHIGNWNEKLLHLPLMTMHLSVVAAGGQ